MTEWTCPNCGSTEPHHAIEFPQPDDERFQELGIEPEQEIEVDVTCESVYITPIDDGNGFAFTHEEFETVIDHFQDRPEQ